jgi:chemotaxis response regulator CheB
MKKKRIPPSASSGQKAKRSRIRMKKIPKRLRGVSPGVATLKRKSIRALARAERNAAETHELDLRADSVHHLTNQLHEKLQDLHDTFRVARSAIDAPELVINERTDAGGKPFPIVGIGASAGGFEAFSDDLRAPLPSMRGYAQLLCNRLGNALDDTTRTYFASAT